MNDSDANRSTWIPQVVIIVLLLVAFNPGNPYGYYVGLRWACFACFSFLAYRAFEKKMIGWVWTMTFLAVAYNPFPVFKIPLGREIWSVVNVASIGIALGSIFAFRPSRQQSDGVQQKSGD